MESKFFKGYFSLTPLAVTLRSFEANFFQIGSIFIHRVLKFNYTQKIDYPASLISAHLE